MIFELENRIHSQKVNKKELEHYLKLLDGSTCSYAILEKEDGSYMQVGGGPLEFTVEARKYLTGSNFTHMKAHHRNFTSSGTTKIEISGSLVSIQSNQVMNLETVLLLFKLFLDGEYFPTIVEWDDITNMFA